MKPTLRVLIDRVLDASDRVTCSASQGTLGYVHMAYCLALMTATRQVQCALDAIDRKKPAKRRRK